MDSNNNNNNDGINQGAEQDQDHQVRSNADETPDETGGGNQSQDGPVEDEDHVGDEGDDDSDQPSAPVGYQPKVPARCPPPAIFKEWRQEKYGTMMMQAVLKDDADTLTWMLQHDLVDLAETDDLGNTAAHLAVFHDSPRVLRLLHSLGLDLSATCDAQEFGSAIFYSVYLGRVECLQELIALGYDMSPPCDRFGRTPEIVAERHDQGAALVLIRRSLVSLDMQRLIRGFLGRQKAKRIKAAWARGDMKIEQTAEGGDGGGGHGRGDNDVEDLGESAGVGGW